MSFFSFLFILTSILEFLSSDLLATDYHPWFGNTLEIESEASCQLNTYRSIDSGSKSRHCPSCDLFFDLSMGTSFQDIAAELEVCATDTYYQNFGMDSIKLTGRYRFLNDIVGDAVSLVSGISIAQVFKPGLRNLSSFHHGGIECEVHLAAGREQSYRQFWVSRTYGVIGVGVADIGYPWVRGDIAWEHNFCDIHEVGFFAHSLWGLGHRSLASCRHFHGYGPIRHQMVDAGLRYARLLREGGRINVEYAHRLFAKNCPKNVNIIFLGIFYPLSL